MASFEKDISYADYYKTRCGLMPRDKFREFEESGRFGYVFKPTPEFEEEVEARKLQVQRAWSYLEKCSRGGYETPLTYFRENGVYDPPPWLGWSVPETRVPVRYKPMDDGERCDCPYWMHELRNNE